MDQPAGVEIIRLIELFAEEIAHKIVIVNTAPTSETLENNRTLSGAELITVTRLGALIDTPEATLRDWVHDGHIPYVKLPTGGIRFEVSKIRRWWRRGAVEPIANRLMKQ